MRNEGILINEFLLLLLLLSLLLLLTYILQLSLLSLSFIQNDFYCSFSPLTYSFDPGGALVASMSPSRII